MTDVTVCCDRLQLRLFGFGEIINQVHLIFLSKVMVAFKPTHNTLALDDLENVLAILRKLPFN